MGEHKANPTALAARMGMLAPRQLQPQSRPVNVTVGHTEDQIVITYSENVSHIAFTLEQAEDHAKVLGKVIEHFKASAEERNTPPDPAPVAEAANEAPQS